MSSEIKIPSGLCLDGPLWQFAGRFWSRSLAQASALALQDRGWSVTDILCALWQARQGQPFRGFGDPANGDADQVLHWRRQVTETLRAVRKAIPKGQPETDPAREAVAHSELEAERVELALAFRALIRESTGGRVAPHQRTAKTLALENLQAAAPESTMDHDTVRLLDTLTQELETCTAGVQQTC